MGAIATTAATPMATPVEPPYDPVAVGSGSSVAQSHPAGQLERHCEYQRDCL